MSGDTRSTVSSCAAGINTTPYVTANWHDYIRQTANSQ
jgi:hypothetical protein